MKVARKPTKGFEIAVTMSESEGWSLGLELSALNLKHGLHRTPSADKLHKELARLLIGGKHR